MLLDILPADLLEHADDLLLLLPTLAHRLPIAVASVHSPLGRTKGSTSLQPVPTALLGPEQGCNVIGHLDSPCQMSVTCVAFLLPPVVGVSSG